MARQGRVWRIAKAWFGFGLSVANFQSRLLLTYLYFALVAPLGLLVRAISDPLRSGIPPVTPSFWMKRDSGDAAPDAGRGRP